MCPLWSKETVLKLIAYYRCKEVLWDPKNPNYYNGILKNRAWVQLGLEMNCPVLRVKKKIESLSASLRREKAKRKKAGQGFTSSWIFYKPLLFLLHRRKIDTNDNSMSGESSQGEPGPKAEVDTDEEPQNSTEEPDFPQEQSEEEPQSPHSAQEANVCYPELDNVKQYKRPKLNSFKRPAVPKRIRQFSDSQKMVTSMLEVLANASVAVKDAAAKTVDDDQIYANFLACKFRNYSQHTRNLLQHKINNLLFQADSGHFDYQTTVVFEPQYPEKPVECLLEGSDEAA